MSCALPFCRLHAEYILNLFLSLFSDDRNECHHLRFLLFNSEISFEVVSYRCSDLDDRARSSFLFVLRFKV